MLFSLSEIPASLRAAGTREWFSGWPSVKNKKNGSTPALQEKKSPFLVQRVGTESFR